MKFIIISTDSEARLMSRLTPVNDAALGTPGSADLLSLARALAGSRQLA